MVRSALRSVMQAGRDAEQNPARTVRVQPASYR